MSWNDTVIEEFRAGKERIANTFDRSALLLLHTTGARSGEPRTSPLAYLLHGDQLIIVASAAGSDKHPAWYFNLTANPRVGVELWAGDAIDSFEATASTLDGEERDQLWGWVVERGPGFGVYQTQTSRVIPLVRLQRA